MENAQETTVEAEEAAPDNVVRLAEYRRRRKAATAEKQVAQDWGPQYYCLRCDGDEFKLYASGVVHCAHCGSMMRNLLINGSKAEEAPNP
jgi:ribosomal protein L37AE/L43A